VSNDFVELLVILCAIYLLECAQWVPARSIGFVRRALRFRWKLPWRGSSRWSRGAVVGMPWPPLLSPLVADPLPRELAFSPGGLIIAGSDSPRLVAWEKLGAVTVVKRRLLIDDAVTARFATRRGAAAMGACLRATKQASGKTRAKKLRRFLDARFDRAVVSERLRDFARQTRWLRLAANLLWLSLFVGVPLLLFTALAPFWAALLSLFAAAWLCSSVLFFVTLRRVSSLPRELWPDGSHRFMAIASPLSTMRSHDLIARELLADLDPLAVAAALLPAPELAEQARLQLVELDHHDHRETSSAREGEVRSWLRAEIRERIVHLLRESALDPDALLAAPPIEDPSCRAYCPRCRTQYTEGDSCANAACDGIALVAFDRRERP
jgi:hypothetical protein